MPGRGEMNCPSCGASNRDGATFCDSCGEPIVAGATRPTDSNYSEGLDRGTESEEPLLEKGGLTGLMAIDWTLRFATVALIGIVVGFITIGMGEYGFSVFFFLLGVVGIAGTWYMIKAKA